MSNSAAQVTGRQGNEPAKIMDISTTECRLKVDLIYGPHFNRKETFLGEMLTQENKKEMAPKSEQDAQKWLEQMLGEQPPLEKVVFRMRKIPQNILSIRQVATCKDYVLRYINKWAALKQNLAQNGRIMDSLNFIQCENLWPDMLAIPSVMNCSKMFFNHSGAIPNEFLTTTTASHVVADQPFSTEVINSMIRKIAFKMFNDPMKSYYIGCDMEEDFDQAKIFEGVVHKKNGEAGEFGVYWNLIDTPGSANWREDSFQVGRVTIRDRKLIIGSLRR